MPSALSTLPWRHMLAVDALVVDRLGTPILGLLPDDFSVSVNGQTRRVVSATLVKYADTTLNIAGAITPPLSLASLKTPGRVPDDGRLFVIAVDEPSFLTTDMKSAVQDTGFDPRSRSGQGRARAGGRTTRDRHGQSAGHQRRFQARVSDPPLASWTISVAPSPFDPRRFRSARRRSWSSSARAAPLAKRLRPCTGALPRAWRS